MIIRKRTIISIFLTLIGIFLLKNFWIDCKLSLIIISIILFLFFYKIFDYIANFNTLENKSRIDVFFLLIFFIWLFVPMIHINKGNYSILENREKAKFVGLINDNKINYDFGKIFNNWFNDRFCLRDDLVKLYSQISLTLLKKCSKGYIEKDWIYWDTNKKQKYDKENLESLIKFQKFCEDNDIRLYVFIVPDKNDIYFSKKSNRYTHISNEYVNKEILEQKDSKNIKIIYPYKKFLYEKNDKLLYFKTEHHWTDDGAFIGYSELMKIIKKDYPSVNVQTEKDYNYFYNNLVRGDFDRDWNYMFSVGLFKKTI